jgi:hypothetical protein
MPCPAAETATTTSAAVRQSDHGKVDAVGLTDLRFSEPQSRGGPPKVMWRGLGGRRGAPMPCFDGASCVPQQTSLYLVLVGALMSV